ncbi:hypothetical protein HT031_002792 [Scenedesmus sp. PABB004]|nr:hypothetical protein HT031_002792 [Scenedesmus sp. PABB004]
MGGGDCLSSATTTAMALGAAGVPVGFFRAHVTLKDLTLAQKMQRWQNVKLTARLLANPMATFAACGFAYAAAECETRRYLGRRDVLSGIVGGAAAGCVLGLKTNSAPNALKYSALFAGAMVVTEFLSAMVPALVGDIKPTGPVMPAPRRGPRGGGSRVPLLELADRLEAAVAAQRARGRETASRAAWAAAHKQLAEEGEAQQRRARAALAALSRSPGLDAVDNFVAQLLEESFARAEAAQSERLSLLAQVQELAHLVRCAGLRGSDAGPGGDDDALASLRQELAWLRADLDEQAAQLAAQAEELAADVPASRGAPSRSASLRCRSSSSASADDDAAATAVGRAGGASGADPGSPRASDGGRADDGRAAADAQLEQLLAAHPLAPAELRQQVRDAFAALARQHAERQQQLADPPDGCGGDRHGGDRHGGWPADEHALFVRLRRLAFGAGAGARGGCARGAVLERLALMMPGRPLRELEAHEAWHTAACLRQRRAADVNAAWRRQRGAFLADSGRMLGEAAAAAAAGAEAAAAALAWAAAGSSLHARLDGLQQARAAADQELAAQRDAAAQAAAARAAAARAEWEQAHAAQRGRVQEYKQHLQEQAEQARQAAGAAAAAARAAAEAEVAAAAPAVAARQAAAEEQQRAQLVAQRGRQAALAARQARLASISAALAPQAPHDPARLLKPTSSSAAAAAGGAAAAAEAAGAAFRPVHGWTAAEVAADPRFRLAEALGRAGLLAGPARGYARAALAAAQPASRTRADTLTTGQRAAAAAASAGR